MRENYLSELIAKTVKDKSAALQLFNYHEYEKPKSFRVVTQALVNPANCFTSFSMIYSTIPYEGMDNLAKAIAHQDNMIESLNFSNTNLGIIDAETLAKALIHCNSKVVFLDLANGFMGQYSTRSIAGALTHPNCKVTYLNLSHSRVGIKGAKHLAEALANKNCHLVYLNLDEGNFWSTVDGYSEITESLSGNFYLLYLSNVNTAQAAEYIQRNQELFKSNCQSVLRDDILSAEDRVMLFRQCMTLLQIDPVIKGITKDEMQAVVSKLRESAAVKPVLSSIPSVQPQNNLASAAPVSLTDADSKPSLTYDATPYWQQQTEQAQVKSEVIQAIS